MTDKPLTIFLSAAEASGDHHAANLMRALRRRVGEIRFVGAAGPKMAAEGCEVVVDLTPQASMVGGPFLRLRYYYRNVRRLQEAIRQVRPDVHVPVDSPALNWHLAKTARSCGAAVVYYIAPQVWAWAPWRAAKLARLTDAVACILPFEQDYFRARGINATYVGHPLFDDLQPPPAPLPDLSLAWADGTWRVAMVPGSRPGEIRGHTPAMWTIAQTIRRRWPASVCIFTAQDSQAAQLIRKACPQPLPELPATVVEAPPGTYLATGRTHQVLGVCHFGLIKSGTVTLEAAWYGLPMVIVYRTGWLMGALHRTLGRVRALMPTPSLSLINILAGRRLVDEIMPWHGNVRRLQGVVMDDMKELGHLCDLRQAMPELVRPLHAAALAQAHPDMSARAADNAAEIVLRTIGRA